MRAVAILGPGNVVKTVAAFQRRTGIKWIQNVEQADAAVIFGGDGTVHHSLSELVELKIPALVVPCGSGNDFARALGIRRMSDAVAAWRKFAAGGAARSIDLGVISSPQQSPLPQQKYFCCVAGVGIDTAIARRANALPKWLRARGGYALHALREISRFTPFAMRVSQNGTQAAEFRPMLLAAIANTPAYGGGMRIAPHAKLDDGKLDLCRIEGMNVFKLLCLFPTVYFGRHLGIKQVRYEQTERLRLETESPVDVYADGEYVCQTPVEFSVAPGTLKIIAFN